MGGNAFNPDYAKCRKPQKDIHHNVCRQIRKDTYMYCGEGNTKCVAWEGYVHEDQYGDNGGRLGGVGMGLFELGMAPVKMVAEEAAVGTGKYLGGKLVDYIQENSEETSDMAEERIAYSPERDPYANGDDLYQLFHKEAEVVEVSKIVEQDKAYYTNDPAEKATIIDRVTYLYDIKHPDLNIETFNEGLGAGTYEVIEFIKEKTNDTDLDNLSSTEYKVKPIMGGVRVVINGEKKDSPWY